MIVVISILAAVFLLPSPWGAIAIVGAMAIEVLEIVFWLRFLRRYRVQTGVEGLLGTVGEVVEPCDPKGRVRLRGELWWARAAKPLGRGERARVEAVDGLTVEVAPAEERGGAA